MIAKWQMQIMVVIFSSNSKLCSRSTTIVINLNILSSRNKRGSILVNCMICLSTGFGKMRIVMGVFSCNLGDTIPRVQSFGPHGKIDFRLVFRVSWIIGIAFFFLVWRSGRYLLGIQKGNLYFNHFNLKRVSFCRNFCKGSFTKYVDKILSFLDHLPPCVDIFYGMNVDKKCIFVDLVELPCLVNVVCVRPLIANQISGF